MKFYNIEMPSDLSFPELDNETKAEIDALHAAMLRDREQAIELVAQRRAQGYHIPSDEEIIGRMQRDTDTRPPREPAVNVAALRQLPPRTRAIFAYLYRQHISE
ncbi:MAG: hypothetical protein ABW202_14410 [Duganella sp.]